MVSRSAADLVTLLVVAAVIAATTACAARPEEKLELVIGANLELSGQDAQLGQAHRNAMQLMVEQHDADRDVDIIVVYRDNRGSPENARRITQNMLTDDGIDAIVGGATASTAAALGAAAGESDKPVMLLAPDSGPVDPAGNPNVFATSAGPDVIADATLSQLRQRGETRVAVLGAQEEYGRAGAAELAGKAPDFGITVTENETFSLEEDGLTAPVNAVTDGDSDAVAVWSPRVAATALARRLRQADADLQVYFASGVGSQVLLTEPAAEGVSLICPAIVVAGTVAATTPSLLAQRQFFTNYTQRFGTFVPDAAVAADAIGIFARAATDAKGVSIEQLREQLQELSYDGIAGAYEFTGTRHNGLTRSSFTTVTARNGSWSPV